MRPVEAVRYAGEVLRDHPTLVWTGQDFRIEVTDAKQLVLFTVIVGGVDAPAGGRSTNPALRRRAYRESFGDQLMAGMGGKLPLRAAAQALCSHLWKGAAGSHKTSDQSTIGRVLAKFEGIRFPTIGNQSADRGREETPWVD